MKTSTKLIAVGAGALGASAAAFGVTRMIRRRAKQRDVDSMFDASDVGDISDIADSSDVETPVVVTEEVVVITEPGYDVDVDLIPSDDPRVRR